MKVEYRGREEEPDVGRDGHQQVADEEAHEGDRARAQQVVLPANGRARQLAFRTPVQRAACARQALMLATMSAILQLMLPIHHGKPHAQQLP